MGDLLHQLVHGLCTLYLKIHCKFHANICFLFYHTGVHCHFRDVVCKLILQYLQYFAFIIYMQDCMTIAWKCISEITINTDKNLPNTPCLFTNNLQKQRFGMMNDVKVEVESQFILCNGLIYLISISKDISIHIWFNHCIESSCTLKPPFAYETILFIWFLTIHC